MILTQMCHVKNIEMIDICKITNNLSNEFKKNI